MKNKILYPMTYSIGGNGGIKYELINNNNV